MYISSKLAIATIAICASTPFAFAAPSSQLTMNQLKQAHPKLQTMAIEGRITKMVAPDMATGKTPMHAARNFLRTWSHSLEVNANEFIAEGPFEDGHHTQQIMYNQETGLYKFTGVYFKQLADGLPVYGTRLMTLSRNVANNPIVNVEVNLRDVKGFKKPTNQ